MTREYFTINENTARVAKEINSFSAYVSGSATEGYKAAVNEVYDIADRIAEVKPQYAEKAAYMAARYAKKYADYLNAYYRNESSCPSVLVCGAGNFPTGKKKRQNSRRESLMAEYTSLIEYRRKISNILTNKQPILSSDEDAIERLQDKIADMEAEQAKMKAINAYYRKNKTCVGCELLDDEHAKRIDEALKSPNCWYAAPFPGFKLSNNNANIKTAKARLEKLQAVKEAGNTEEVHEGYTVKEDTEIMRLQIFFDTIPSNETRTLLKSNGFKWSPKNQAWQRQLTDNAKMAFRRIRPQL